MNRLICVFLSALTIFTAQTVLASIRVADQLLVNVSASSVTGIDGSPVTAWSNAGSLAGSFDKWGGCSGATYFANVHGAPALWFDGTTNTVLVASFPDTPEALSGGDNTWSAEFWLLCPSITLANGDFMSWTRRPGAGGNNTLAEFRYGTDGICGEHHSGNVDWKIKPPQAHWHHIVLTRDSAKVERLYVNSVLINQITLANLNVRTDGQMVFGATMNLDNNNFQFPYYGYIGQARIHTGVLSDLDVAQNYATELPNYTYTPYADGTTFVDLRASDLSSLTPGDFVGVWADNSDLNQPFASTVNNFGPTYQQNVQGAAHAVQFDGFMTNVLVGGRVPAELTASPTYTLETWLNSPTLDSKEAIFLSWTPRSTVNGTITEYRYHSGPILCEHYNANVNEFWGFNTPPAANQWHHIAVTRDGATGATVIYVDGKVNNSQTILGLTIRSDGLFVLGGVANNDPRAGGFVNNWGYTGYMGALRISAGVKNGLNILNTYNAEAPAYGLAPISIGGDGAWVSPTGGNWSDGTKWDPQTPVDGATLTASFFNGGGNVINDMSDLTLFGMLFGSPVTTVSGNPITFADGSFIKGFAATNTVATALTLEGTFTANPMSGGNGIALTGDITGPGTFINVGGHTILSGNNTFTGGITNQLGTLEVNAFAALGLGAITLGDGTFRYTGPTTTFPRPIRTETLIANRPTTINITDANATLTLTGAFEGNAPFFKRGPGALVFAHDGDQTLNTGANSSSALTAFDLDGVLLSGTYGAFSIEDGTVTLGMPGKTTTLRNNNNVFIGTRDTTVGKAARLNVTAGTLSLPDGGWLCINRGTLGDSSVHVSGANTRLQTSAGIVLAYSEGVPNHTSTAVLDIDEATVIAGGNAFINESGTSSSIVNVRNGATFEVNIVNNQGLSVPQSLNSQATVTADNATIRATHLSVNSGGTFNVRNGARLENDLPSVNVLARNNPANNKGTLTFDNATFAQRSAAFGLWLLDMPRVFVDNGGLTLNATGWASLDAALSSAPGATTPTVNKTGAGTATVRSPTIPITAKDGTLGVYSTTMPSLSNPPPASTLTMDGGDIAPETEGALFNQTINPSGADRLVFSPAGTLRFWDMWQMNGMVNDNTVNTVGRFARNDGWLQIANGIGNQATSFFLKEKQTVTGPWTASFTFIGNALGADGFTFVMHNDARGANALGGLGWGFGYAGNNAINNSVGVIFNVYGTPMNMGNIKLVRSVANVAGDIVTVKDRLTAFSLRDNMVKTFFTLSYDGTSTLTCTLRRADGRVDECVIPDIDIRELVGDDTAYIGFTAGTGGQTFHGAVGDIAFDDGVTSMFRQDIVQYGGTVDVGTGTLNARINNVSPLQSVAALDTLTFSDGATLNVGAPFYPYTYEFESVLPNLLANQSDWQLNGNALWVPDGSVCVTTAGTWSVGTVFSTTRYEVANAWTAKLTYRQENPSTDPADFVTFTVQNLSPTENLPSSYLIPQGLTVRWDYFQSKPETRLEIYMNGVNTPVTPIVTTPDPVNLRNGEVTYMTITHDPLAQTLTVLTEQPGISASHTHTFTGINVADSINASDGKAYIGCTGRTGGQWAENYISEIRFTTGTRLSSDAADTAALGFRHYDGTGTINHQGVVPLALMGDVDAVPEDVTLRLSGGGLNLRRISDEPLGTTITRGDWLVVQTNSPSLWTPFWMPNGDIAISTNMLPYLSTGFASARRINVARDFTATFTYITTNAAADGMCLIFHNDPRGPSALGGGGGDMGYIGNSRVLKSFALRFNLYQGNQIGIGKNGVFGIQENTINLKNTTINVTVNYDSTANTIEVTCTDAATGLTQVHLFTDIDIAALAESDYATVTFVGATGSQYALQYIRNFILRYPAPVTVTDERLAINATEIPEDGSQTFTLDVPTVANPMFLITDGLFGDGATLRLTSKTAGTLRYAHTTLDGALTLDIKPGTTLILGDITGTDATVTTGTLTLTGIPDGATLTLGTGTLNVGTGNKLTLRGATLNGQKIPAGIYTPDNTTWVTAGQVNIGAIGTIIILR